MPNPGGLGCLEQQRKVAFSSLHRDALMSGVLQCFTGCCFSPDPWLRVSGFEEHPLGTTSFLYSWMGDCSFLLWSQMTTRTSSDGLGTTYEGPLGDAGGF